jgi:hypothetical protein
LQSQVISRRSGVRPAGRTQSSLSGELVEMRLY